MNDKKFENVRSGKSFWYKEIIFGIIFLIIVFVGSAQVDKKAAKSQVNSTISYVKTQCSIYARYNDATETKSNMRGYSKYATGKSRYRVFAVRSLMWKR